MEMESLVSKAVESTLFTAPILGKDLQRFIEDKSKLIQELANEFMTGNFKHIFWVGAGNSWMNLYSGKYLLDKFTNINNDLYNSFDFVTREPYRLNEKSWVFLASFSGGTEDTIEGLRYAKSKGAKTIAIVNKKDSLMGKEADIVIDYNSKALYILPLAFVYLFALEIAKSYNQSEAIKIINNLNSLPKFLEDQFTNEKDKAKNLANKFLNEDTIFTMGSGPLYGIAYKFGLTVFMENMRIMTSFMDTTEFRHGPAEMLERHKPAFVILKGTDSTRDLVERVSKIVENQGCKLLVFDVKDYPNVHPLLAPFVLMIPLQWFAVYSSLMRGITDLDERVLMGRGVMGKGKGVTWP